MKVRLTTYLHSQNGVSLQLVPETPVEESLLKGVWNHGKLKTGHPSKAEQEVNVKYCASTGFYVTWDQKNEQT